MSVINNIFTGKYTFGESQFVCWVFVLCWLLAGVACYIVAATDLTIDVAAPDKLAALFFHLCHVNIGTTLTAENITTVNDPGDVATWSAGCTNNAFG